MFLFIPKSLLPTKNPPLFSSKSLRALVIPLIIEQFLNSLMGTADAMMVTGAGSAAISAVSLVDSINVLVVNVFSAMATGGAILSSQYLGHGLDEKARHSGSQLILCVFFLSIFGSALCILFKKPLLSLIFGRVEKEVMDGAVVYFFITALSFPFIALYNAAAALFRSAKNSRLPMTISMISNILNVAGNAVLIFVFSLGVKGAALSTLISRIFSAITLLFFLRKSTGKIRLETFFFRADFGEMAKILKVGLPTGIENGMFQFGKLAIQSTVSLMGMEAIAANAMTASLESLSCQGAQGIGIAMMTVSGQCVGAGEDYQASQYIKRLTRWGFVALVLSSVVVSAAIFPITRISKMSAEAASLACFLTWIVHAVKPFVWGGSFLPAYGLRAAGDVRFSMLVSMTTMWTCRVLTVVILARGFGFGPLAVWIGMIADWTVRSICFAIRFRSGRWLLHKLS